MLTLMLNYLDISIFLRGVKYHKGKGWSASIKHASKRKLCGYYPTEAAAAAAWDLAAIRIRGAAAQTNFPLEGYAEALMAAAEGKVGCAMIAPPSVALCYCAFRLRLVRLASPLCLLRSH